MKRGIVVIAWMMSVYGLTAQPSKTSVKSPKLVVGMMVDQMRWDFIYRYQHRYGEGGFKRILREGFTNEAHIPLVQTVTAIGHACVYTGSVPAFNGIMGNEWYDRSLKRSMYCVEDDSVSVIGGKGNFGPMSPRNLQSTTISDELELATNFRSKIVGVALKDRVHQQLLVHEIITRMGGLFQCTQSSGFVVRVAMGIVLSFWILYTK